MKKFLDLGKVIGKSSIPKQEPKKSIDIPIIEKEVSQAKLQLTNLKNGVKILTESSTFPGNVIIGAAFKSGTRNESAPETLRSIKLIHNLSHSPQASDYLQQLGSDISISYSEEFTSFYTKSLSYNTKKLSKVLYDSIFLEYDSNLQEVLQKKLKNFYSKNLDFMEFVEKNILFHCFKQNPANLKEKIQIRELNNHVQGFHTSGNLCIFAGGVYNHFEFVDLVSGYFKDLPETEELVLEPYAFDPKTVNVMQDLPFGCYSICVPGESWGSDQFWVQKLLSDLVSSTFSQAQSDFPYVSEVFSNSYFYSDTGLFVITFIAPPEYLSKSMSFFNTLLEKVLKISPEEFNTIKQQFKLNYFLSSENHEQRLLKTVQKFLLTKKLEDTKSVFSEIDKVKIEDLANMVERFLGSKSVYFNIGPGFSR